MASPSIPLESVRGTRDFYPDDILIRDWLFDIWRRICKSYAYKEYDAPVVEHALLWNAKSGDDILNEMFTLEKEGVQLVLRPEMTPTLARMVMNCYKTTTQPIRWFSLPQCWRYETTARGRKREFYQLNVDFLANEKNIKAEIEIFQLIVDMLNTFLLTNHDVVIRLSDRRILQNLTEKFNIPEAQFAKTCNLIDKINKLSKQDFNDMLHKEIGLSHEQIEEIHQIVAIKDPNDLTKHLPNAKELIDELNQLFYVLGQLGISEWFELDLSVVRGLSYYTGIVFEGFFKNSDMKRAILGGGRYDKLLATYGGDPLPAVGLGMGDVVLLDVLNERGLIPKLSHKLDYIVIPFDESLFIPATKIAKQIRSYNQNIHVELYASNKYKLKNALDYANRIQANYAIIIAPQEYLNNQIIIKNMNTHKQHIIHITQITQITQLKL